MLGPPAVENSAALAGGIVEVALAGLRSLVGKMGPRLSIDGGGCAVALRQVGASLGCWLRSRCHERHCDWHGHVPVTQTKGKQLPSECVGRHSVLRREDCATIWPSTR